MGFLICIGHLSHDTGVTLKGQKVTINSHLKQICSHTHTHTHCSYSHPSIPMCWLNSIFDFSIICMLQKSYRKESRERASERKRHLSKKLNAHSLLIKFADLFCLYFELLGCTQTFPSTRRRKFSFLSFFESVHTFIRLLGKIPHYFQTVNACIHCTYFACYVYVV